jgi:hypothetical protein
VLGSSLDTRRLLSSAQEEGHGMRAPRAHAIVEMFLHGVAASRPQEDAS